MINTQKFLKSENSGSFFERANRKLISVNSMLKGSLAQRKARQRIKKKQEERRKREEEETRLEDTKSQKNPNNILKSLPRGPRDFISSFKEAIGKILFAFFSIKLLKALPLLKNILPMVFGAVDFVSGLGVGLIDGLATFIDFGYKAYDSTQGFLKKVGGDGFAAGFEKFMGAVSTLIDILLLATVVRGMGDFGPGKPKKPKARRLRFLDFRKKGSGVAPPAKPKPKPTTPKPPPAARARIPRLIPKPAPKPAFVASLVPRRVVKPAVKPAPVPEPAKRVIKKTSPQRSLVTAGGAGGGAADDVPTKPPKTTPSKTKPIKKLPPTPGSGIKTGIKITDEVKDQFMNNLNELLRAEGKEKQFRKRMGMPPKMPTSLQSLGDITARQIQNNIKKTKFYSNTDLLSIANNLDLDFIQRKSAFEILKKRNLSYKVQNIPNATDYFQSPSTRKNLARLQGQKFIAPDIPKRPVVKPAPITKPPSLFSQLRKISPASAAKGVTTAGASIAIELALQSLVDMGMDGINKYFLQRKIENLLKKSPEDLKEYVSKLIEKTERELKYQKGPLALFDKIVAAGGDTSSDIKLRESLAILYGLAAAGVEFEDFDISDFLLQEKRFTDVTGLKPIQIDKRETEQLSATQKRRMSRRGTGTRKTDEPQGAALSGDLKAEIRSAESGNDYGATFRKYLGGFSRANEDITKMSINQVVQYQRDYLNHQRKLGIPITQRSAAVGAYQMLEPDTAAKALGVPLSRKFDQKTQDLLANYYLNAAGRKEFETGKISAEEYNNRLAGQFASLRTTSGRGRYDDDGLNKAYKDILPLLKNKQNDRSQSLKTSASYDDQASNVIVVNKKQVLANMNNNGGGDGNVLLTTSSGSDRSRSRLYMI